MGAVAVTADRRFDYAERPTAEPFAAPDQAALEGMLAAMAG